MSQVPSNLIPTRLTQLPLAPVADENSLMMIVWQGNNYQIRVGDLLSVAGVPTSTQVIAGTGLTGGGQLTGNVTLSVAPGGITTPLLAPSGVTSGQYGSATEIPVFGVDATGRIVNVTTVPVQSSGVPTTREVIAGTGLNGGGALNANVTLNANLSNSTPLATDGLGVAGVSTNMSRADHQHPSVNLQNSNEIDGVLSVANGGTSRSIVPDEGAIIWSGADGLYVGPVGVSGQVLQSTGAGEYIWVDQNTLDVGQADNINGGAANRILYQTGVGTTGFVPAPTISNTILYWNGSSLVWGSVPGTGTVTSVGLSLPAADFAVSGSPVTGSGTLTAAWLAQPANRVLSGPTSGSDDTPSFRPLVNADIPSALSGKTITGSAINSTTIGNVTPSSGVFTTVDATDVTASLIDATNLEVMNLKAKDGTAAGSIADTTGVVTLNSAVLTTADINGGTLDGVVIGGSSPAAITGTTITANSGFTGNLSGNATTATTATNLAGGASGSLPYNSGSGTTTFLGLGTTNYVLTAGASAPQYTAQSALSVGSATTATTSTNVAGGAANKIVYNTGSGTTSFVDAPTISDTFLKWNGSAFAWATNPLGTVTSVDVSGGTTGLTTSGGPITSSGTITLAGTLGAANGGLGHASYSVGDMVYASATTTISKLTIGTSAYLMTSSGSAPQWTNPSSVTVGTATNATNATNAVNVGTTATTVNATFYPVFVDATTGNNNAEVSSSFTFNPSTNTLSATNFSGNASTATSATSATTATNLAGGAASQIPYQTGSGATTFLANGTAGQVLTSAGSSAPTWSGINGGTF